METGSMHEKDLLMLQTQVVVGDEIKAGYGKIKAGELTDEDFQNLAEVVRDSLVPVADDAPCCCIDGRNCVHTLDGQETTARPSVAGGPVTAYAAAEMVGWFGEDDTSSPSERYDRLDAYLNAAGMPTGIHADEAAEDCNFADNKTGCGADDRFLENVDHVYRDHDGVQGFTASLLGDSFNETHMEFKTADDVQQRNQAWNPVAIIESIRTRNAAAVEVLKSDETETHGHQESAVVFNFVDDHTVDRDALVSQTGNQVFTVDMWYIDKLAKAMASGPRADEQYSRLKHAMVAYQIGTYLTLCDGSQRIMILSQQS